MVIPSTSCCQSDADHFSCRTHRCWRCFFTFRKSWFGRYFDWCSFDPWKFRFSCAFFPFSLQYLSAIHLKCTSSTTTTSSHTDRQTIIIIFNSVVFPFEMKYSLSSILLLFFSCLSISFAPSSPRLVLLHSLFMAAWILVAFYYLLPSSVDLFMYVCALSIAKSTVRNCQANIDGEHFESDINKSKQTREKKELLQNDTKQHSNEKGKKPARVENTYVCMYSYTRMNGNKK